MEIPAPPSPAPRRRRRRAGDPGLRRRRALPAPRGRYSGRRRPAQPGRSVVFLVVDARWPATWRLQLKAPTSKIVDQADALRCRSLVASRRARNEQRKARSAMRDRSARCRQPGVLADHRRPAADLGSTALAAAAARLQPMPQPLTVVLGYRPPTTTVVWSLPCRKPDDAYRRIRAPSSVISAGANWRSQTKTPTLMKNSAPDRDPSTTAASTRWQQAWRSRLASAHSRRPRSLRRVHQVQTAVYKRETCASITRRRRWQNMRIRQFASLPATEGHALSFTATAMSGAPAMLDRIVYFSTFSFHRPRRARESSCGLTAASRRRPAAYLV